MGESFPPPPSGLNSDSNEDNESLASTQSEVEATTDGSGDQPTQPDSDVTLDEPDVTETDATEDPEATKSETSDVPKMSNPEDVNYVGPVTTVDQHFTYPTHTDPQRHNTSPGIYLDDLERERAEVTRAKIEGREPNLVDPPATVGTPLAPTHVVKSSLPGDFVVEPDVTLPVSVGIPDQNVTDYGEAQQERKVAEAYGVER